MFRLGDEASWVLIVLVLLVGMVIGDGLHGVATPAVQPQPSPSSSPWQPPVPDPTLPPMHFPDSDFNLSPSPTPS